MPKLKADERIIAIHAGIATQAAREKHCVLAVRPGCGTGRIAAVTAGMLENKNLLAVVPKSIAEIWLKMLQDAMAGLYPDLPRENIMNFAGMGRAAGAGACSKALTNSTDQPIACIITPSQIQSVFEWHACNTGRPFGLVIADNAVAFANQACKRSCWLDGCMKSAGASILIARTPQDVEKLSRTKRPIISAVNLFATAMAPGA